MKWTCTRREKTGDLAHTACRVMNALKPPKMQAKSWDTCFSNRSQSFILSPGATPGPKATAAAGLSWACVAHRLRRACSNGQTKIPRLSFRRAHVRQEAIQLPTPSESGMLSSCHACTYADTYTPWANHARTIPPFVQAGPQPVVGPYPNNAVSYEKQCSSGAVIEYTTCERISLGLSYATDAESSQSELCKELGGGSHEHLSQTVIVLVRSPNFQTLNAPRRCRL